MSYKVYILFSKKLDKYYTGSCEDTSVRLNDHNTGRAISTKSGSPWVLKYFEEYSTRSEAMKRENEIKKKKSRKYIEWLIGSSG